MAYAGGKDGPGVWQRAVNQITPHDVFVSAFAGDCAVTRHIRPAASTVLIDLDPDVVRHWESRRWEGLRVYCMDALTWLRHRFRLQAPPQKTAGSSAAGKRRESSYTGWEPVKRKKPFEIPAWQPGADAIFRGMVPGSDPATPPRVFVYLDPPYLLSTRTKQRIYRHELTTEDHWELLRIARQLPCHCLIHGYPSNMYGQALHDWRSFTFLASTRGGQRTEQVWCNYPDPIELHDYAHVGEDRRVRERIARRRRNWLAALKRVGPHERGAILQALLPLMPKQ